MKVQDGTTLFEMLAAVAVVAVLAAFALPAAQGAIYATRSSRALESIYQSWEVATRTALVASTEVVICPGTEAGCQSNADWSEGWIVFSDFNGNRERDSNELLAFQRAPLASGVGLSGSTGRTRLVVQPNGSAAGSNITMILCDRRGLARAKSIVVANSGRIRQGAPGKAAADTCQLAQRR